MSPNPAPSRFFPQLGKIELAGTSAFLEAQQTSLRENKRSGMIEIQIKPDTHALFLFAPDALAGGYLLEGEYCKPLQLTNLSAAWDGAPTPIRVVEFPQTTARAIWLTLEADFVKQMDLTGGEPLAREIKMLQGENFSGTLELRAEKFGGIFYTYEGSSLDAESVYCNDVEFKNPAAIGDIPANVPLTLVVRKAAPAAQAQQCLLLRLGIQRWSAGVLSRYQELVGQKMLKMAQKDIDDVVQPWGWQITVEHGALRDRHFFVYPQTAAQAYRAVFMEIGSQMDQVVGAALTRRILGETFEPLPQSIRLTLELHRLIPAAFSE